MLWAGWYEQFHAFEVGLQKYSAQYNFLPSQNISTHLSPAIIGDNSLTMICHRLMINVIS